MTDPGAAALTAIGQIAVTVRDLPRATTFYRDVLGLPLLFEVAGMAFFDAGGVRLMLAVPTDPRYDHPASILYYRVADIHAAAARLAAAGAAFAAEPHLV
ncbi:MAG TPA: VOC family protein, partial [Gemmatimonadales bacterium]|nr:VOC family protein [Gemmatimonadales bacterium]